MTCDVEFPSLVSTWTMEKAGIRLGGATTALHVFCALVVHAGREE